MTSLTPAQLAWVDQTLAVTNPVVDEMISVAAEHVAAQGAETAIAVMATSYERANQQAKLATVAAVAIVRLAQQQLAQKDAAPEDRP